MSTRPTLSDCNLAVVVGSLSRPAELRTLASGTHLVTLEVTVRSPEASTDSVPVSWFDPPAWACELDASEQVVVIGRVRRRFFRSHGATASRTEVVADTVVRARQAKRAASALRAALDRVGDAA